MMTEIAHEGEKPPPPDISVVIPHLNEEDNLGRCLDAIHAARQDGLKIEVIIADNGSNRLPLGVCARYADTRLVVETQPGPGPARNTGAALAGAELICFIDADCFVDRDYFAVCAAFFTAHPEIDFAGGSIGIWPSRPPDLIPSEAYEAAFSYRTEMFVRRDRFAATGNMIVRRRVFRAVGPFVGIARHEDVVWGQKAVSMGFRIAYLPEARVLTAGCRGFGELARRVERHVAHEFAEARPDWRGRMSWLFTAALVLGSPPFAIGEILRCPQIKSFKLCLQVFAYLCRIRTYRAWLMLQALWGKSANAYLARWNRS